MRAVSALVILVALITVWIWTALAPPRARSRSLQVKSVEQWATIRFPVLLRWDAHINDSAWVESRDDRRFRIEFRVQQMEVPVSDALDKRKLRLWMANHAKVETDEIEIGALMGGRLPTAQYSSRSNDGALQALCVFVVGGHRILAFRSWRDQTGQDKKLARELQMMFEGVDALDPRSLNDLEREEEPPALERQ